MTKDEALKMAIEAMQDNQHADAINACKEALDQPAQEPVAVYGILDDGDYVSVEATEKGAIKQCEFMNKHDCNCTYKPLYTHPHQWQGLISEDINKITDELNVSLILSCDIIDFVMAIEAKLKEKNT